MWTIQEFCNATDTYGLQVVRLLAPPPATPSSCSPSTLTSGMSGIPVQLTGTSDGDTGFFDPGPGFSNRISATVNGGGVTVNAVTYSDPTHLTLNVSVSPGATGGGRTITVTNPDGQSATSGSAILTVSATSVPRPLIQSITRTNNLITILWSAIANRTYRVQFKENLDDSNWNDLLPDVTASGPTASKTDTTALGAQRFYRVQALP